MEKNKDILECSKLKENPFKVPEGYFDSLPVRVEARREAGRRGFIARLAPYAAIAASFAIIALAGTAIVKMTVSDSEDEMTTTSLIADGQGISDDDIINFLIYTGISAEQVNELSQE